MYDDLLARYYRPDINGLELTRFRALISALRDEELCDFAFAMLDGKLDLKLRKFVESKVGARIDNGTKMCFTSLVEQLLREVNGSNFRRSQRAASLLEVIATSVGCDPKLKNHIFNGLLDANLLSHRKRVYKYSRSLDGGALEQSLVKNWRRKDRRAVEAIVACFPPDLLSSFYDELLDEITNDGYEEYVERRLYFRAPMTDERLQAILAKDEVTYASVCAKQKIPIPEETAQKLWDNRMESGRPELLIWAFGEVGLWNLLTTLEL